MEGPVESLEAMKTRFEGLDPAVFRADLERLALVSDGAIRIEGLLDVPPQPVPPPCPPLPHLSCHPFAGRIEKRERIASFSYLAAGHGNGLPLPQEGLLDEPDHDGTAWDDVRLPMATEGDRSGLFAFPRGTRAGTALHAILERIEFRDSDRSQWEEIAAAQLQAHGFAPDWRHAVADMIEALVCLPLELDGRSLTLDRIGPQDRIREMAFHLPLNLISPERLRRIFEGRLSTPLQAFPERLARLGFQPTLGYLKGYIDLVFRFKGRYYLIDWKSNDLGNRPEDYTPGVLARAMTSELYVLQYHLYTVALHRFLKARLQDYDYDRHMGGVFYLFLRGIAPGWGLPYGIFSDRPQQKWLEAIEKGLSGETDGRTSGKLSGGFHGP
jgi:exodeoxyribonuclease V beta subunit